MEKSAKYLQRIRLTLLLLALLVLWCVGWIVASDSNPVLVGHYVGIAGLGVFVLFGGIIFCLVSVEKISFQDALRTRGFVATYSPESIPLEILTNFRIATEIGNRGYLNMIACRRDSSGAAWFISNRIGGGRNSRIDSAFVTHTRLQTPEIRVRKRTPLDHVRAFFGTPHVSLARQEVDEQITVKCLDVEFANRFASDQMLEAILTLKNEELVIRENCVCLCFGGFDCVRWEEHLERFDRLVSVLNMRP